MVPRAKEKAEAVEKAKIMGKMAKMVDGGVARAMVVLGGTMVVAGVKAMPPLPKMPRTPRVGMLHPRLCREAGVVGAQGGTTLAPMMTPPGSLCQ